MPIKVFEPEWKIWTVPKVSFFNRIETKKQLIRREGDLNYSNRNIQQNQTEQSKTNNDGKKKNNKTKKQQQQQRRYNKSKTFPWQRQSVWELSILKGLERWAVSMVMLEKC